ncbi:hypothetical protein CDAR_551491 [Caerostris darwini]|uniref:Uncharacterized protein n=1 Tax=Caerostris darwini TaxID=1538125 RepID=A0AAV4V6H8_9ARAC|nr:hypothetical protein CDAR_551491 [Caerostris darwini]
MNLYLAFFLFDLISEKRNFFSKWSALEQRCEKESFQVPEAGVEKKTLLMTAVDREGHISSLGCGKESHSEQTNILMRRGLALSRSLTTPRKDLLQTRANSTYGN